jgi:hypothetical protein
MARPERIFQLLHPSLPADHPPLRTLATLPNNLSLQVTSFVGREVGCIPTAACPGRR